MVSHVPKCFSIFAPYASEGNYISANSGKVKALQFINCDVTATCRDTRDFGLETPSNISQVYVFERGGILVSQEKVLNSVWIKMIRIAGNSQTTNVELEATPNGITLRTVRPIYPGEPLSMWFGKNLRLIFNIPCVSASNIYNIAYKCHLCGKVFSYPNDLLMHQTLKCDLISIGNFWKSLARDWVHVFKPYTDFRIENILSRDNSTHFPKHQIDFRSVTSNLSSNIDYKNLNYDPLIMENEASNIGKTTDGFFQCRICLKKYSRKHGLKIHFRIHTGYKPLLCKVCNRAFGDPSNLNKHVRLHATSETTNKYKCGVCNQGVIRRRDLERHMTLHHPELVNYLEK